MAQVGTIAHVFKWALERADGETAAITVATLAFCSLTGRLICGAVLDRLNLFVFVMIIYALQAVAMFGMALVEGALAVLMLTAFFGFTVGNVLMAQPLLVATAFGVRDFPRILKPASAGNEWWRRFGAGGHWLDLRLWRRLRQWLRVCRPLQHCRFGLHLFGRRPEGDIINPMIWVATRR